MNTTTILLSLAVATIGAIGAYWAAVRKLSGSVETSTAEELWAESKSIRQEYSRRIAILTDRVEALETRNEALSVENDALKEIVGEHQKTISLLREQVQHLTQDNTELRQENIRLRGRVLELETNGS